MPLNTAVVKTGATMAPTGGTDLTFSGTGIKNNTHTIVVAADADLRMRRSIVCTVREPRVLVGAPNGMSQARTSFVFKTPIALDNGLTTVNKVTIEFSSDVETTAAQLEEMRIIAAQICSDADFADSVKLFSLA